MKEMKTEENTRRAYILKKDGSKQWFDITNETAEKVLRLQKMFREDAKKNSLNGRKSRLITSKDGAKAPSFEVINLGKTTLLLYK